MTKVGRRPPAKTMSFLNSQASYHEEQVRRHFPVSRWQPAMVGTDELRFLAYMRHLACYNEPLCYHTTTCPVPLPYLPTAFTRAVTARRTSICLFRHSLPMPVETLDGPGLFTLFSSRTVTKRSVYHPLSPKIRLVDQLRLTTLSCRF